MLDETPMYIRKIRIIFYVNKFIFVLRFRGKYFYRDFVYVYKNCFYAEKLCLNQNVIGPSFKIFVLRLEI